MKPWKPVSRISCDWNRFWTVYLSNSHTLHLTARFFREELPSLEPSRQRKSRFDFRLNWNHLVWVECSKHGTSSLWTSGFRISASPLTLQLAPSRTWSGKVETGFESAGSVLASWRGKGQCWCFYWWHFVKITATFWNDLHFQLGNRGQG